MLCDLYHTLYIQEVTTTTETIQWRPSVQCAPLVVTLNALVSLCHSVLVVLRIPLFRVTVCVCLHHADVLGASDGAM